MSYVRFPVVKSKVYYDDAFFPPLFFSDCNIERHVSSDQIFEHKAKKCFIKNHQITNSSWNEMD